MRKLYLFVNGGNGSDWLDCLSLTDDGHILGNHICSHMNYMMHDLHNRSDRLEKIKAHYGDEPYDVEILSHSKCKNNDGFLKALAIAESKEHDVEKAGAVVTFTE